MRAVSWGRVGSVSAMLGSGAVDLSVGDEEAQTALHLAARDGAGECVEMLVRARASLEARDQRGCTPLTSAVGWQRELYALRLLDAGAQLSNVTCPVPEMFKAFSNMRQRCKDASRAVFRMMKKRAAGRDMAHVVARMVWETRWQGVWFTLDAAAMV